MDLIRTLLMYMLMLLEAAGNASPAMTPPPSSAQPVPAVTATAPSAPTRVPTRVPVWTPTSVPTRVPTLAPTLAPTPTPVAYTTLYVGDRGEDVRKLQRRLTELGYLNDKIDGIYGQNTKRAVERFQYYNNLSVDGIAGKATQAVLFESPNVVVAPPDVTQRPTPSPTPLVGVNVPVYYVDQYGRLLNWVSMMCYGNTTIYANSANVGEGYTLISASAVSVVIRNGVATPSSVTFSYRPVEEPSPEPAAVSIPVYYMTDTGVILTQTTATLDRGKTSYVQVNTTLVPDSYQLTSASAVAVTVTAQGVPTPGSVVFTFRNAAPVPSAEPQQAVVPIRYVTEAGYLLNETYVTVQVGDTIPVYASAGIVPGEYRLISQNPVQVTIRDDGSPVPAVVIFTYAYQAPTAEPTEVPTEMPTEVPTEVPTAAPTEQPTDAPTEAPTEEPTEVPTEEPTAEPTEAPTEEPTAEPTAEPTEAPTEAPTEEPTPEPTAEPTEAPTEAPTEEPIVDPLTKAGDSIQVNGNTVPMAWYQDPSGAAMLNLRALADSVGWSYRPNGESIIMGHSVQASYAGNDLYSLTVDGASQTPNALAWNGDLFVSLRFLQALGVETSQGGGQVSIIIPEG